MSKIILIMMAFMAASVISGCGGEGDNSGQDNGGDETNSTLQVKLRGAQFADENSNAGRPQISNIANNCSVSTTNIGVVSGLCLTPTRIGGHVAQVTLSRSLGGPPARLLGGTLGLDRDGAVTAQDFNLDSATALIGEDNVEDDTAGTSWDYMGVNFASLDVQVPVNGEYWNIRYAFITSPVINDDVIDGCLVEELGNEGEEAPEGEESEEGEEEGSNTVCDDEVDDDCGEGSYRSRVIENAKLYADVEAAKGDVLLCIKSDTSLCADTEYQWLDLANDTLVSTRPSAPYQINEIVDIPTVCEPSFDGPGYDIQLGGFDMFATIRTPFTLGAEFINAQKLYRFGVGETTIAEGIDMTLFIDFDVINAVFVVDETVTSITDADTATILQSIYMSAMYATLNAPEGDLNTNMRVEFNAALEGEPDPEYCPPEDECLDTDP